MDRSWKALSRNSTEWNEVGRYYPRIQLNRPKLEGTIPEFNRMDRSWKALSRNSTEWTEVGRYYPGNQLNGQKFEGAEWPEEK
jgi:hypothetical protein